MNTFHYIHRSPHPQNLLKHEAYSLLLKNSFMSEAMLTHRQGKAPEPVPALSHHPKLLPLPIPKSCLAPSEGPLMTKPKLSFSFT